MATQIPTTWTDEGVPAVKAHFSYNMSVDLDSGLSLEPAWALVPQTIKDANISYPVAVRLVIEVFER